MESLHCRYVDSASFDAIVADAGRIREGLARAVASMGRFLAEDSPLEDLYDDSEALLLAVCPQDPGWPATLPRWPPQGSGNLEQLSPGPIMACRCHGLDCLKRFYIMSFIRWHGANSPMDGTCWPSRIRESVGCIGQWSWQDVDCPWPFPRDITQLETQGLFYLSNLVTGVVLSCLTGYGPGSLFFSTKIGQVAPRVFELMHTGHDPARPPPPYAARASPPPPPPYGPGPEDGGRR